MVTGFRLSQALAVAAELRLAEALADGARTSDELAAEVGADADALYRLLRALARAEVFEEREDRVFALTELGRGLQGEAGMQARFVCRAPQWNPWADLEQTIRTGEPAFEKIFGESPWSWRASRPDESARFDEWMTALTVSMNEAIVSAYDFGRFEHVVDVAGGRGALLDAVLEANPRTRGTLFDQEHVVAGAPPREACPSSPAASSTPSRAAATHTCSSRSCTTGPTRRRRRFFVRSPRRSRGTLG